MRLQDKKQIATSLASERKQEIDRGIELAKKVDAVRETLSEETKNLEHFRAIATEQTRAEIDLLLSSKSLLETEIKDLKAEREILKEPLDKEWHEVKMERTKLNDWSEKIQNESFSTKQRKEEVERREIEVERREDKAVDTLHLASQKLADADAILTNARNTSAEIRNSAHTKLLSAELKEREAAEYEKSVRNLESILKSDKKRLEDFEVDLARRERELKLGWKNLKQTADRITNNKL